MFYYREEGWIFHAINSVKIMHYRLIYQLNFTNSPIFDFYILHRRLSSSARLLFPLCID